MDSDFGIFEGMWNGGELSILGDGLKTWKLSVVGMNVFWTQFHVSKFPLELIQIIIIIIAKCFLLIYN